MVIEEEEFNKMIKQLLEISAAKRYTDDDYKEQVEIRDALESSLQIMKNELHEKYRECCRLNGHNSTPDEIDVAKNRVEKLRGEIYLREEGLKKFYDQLVERLKER